MGCILSLLFFTNKITICHYCSLSFYNCFYLSIYPFPNNPWFLCVCCTSLWKTRTEGKEKSLETSNFTFSLKPVWITFHHFHQIQNCCLRTLSLEKSKLCCLGLTLYHTIMTLKDPEKEYC